MSIAFWTNVCHLNFQFRAAHSGAHCATTFIGSSVIDQEDNALYIGCGPTPRMPVTTSIITSLLGDSYTPSFPSYWEGATPKLCRKTVCRSRFGFLASWQEQGIYSTWYLIPGLSIPIWTRLLLEIIRSWKSCQFFFYKKKLLGSEASHLRVSNGIWHIPRFFQLNPPIFGFAEWTLHAEMNMESHQHHQPTSYAPTEAQWLFTILWQRYKNKTQRNHESESVFCFFFYGVSAHVPCLI